MHPSKLKIYLGLLAQVDKLTTEQGLLKLITNIRFENLSDCYELTEQVNALSIFKNKISSHDFIKAEDYFSEHLNNGIGIIPFGDVDYPESLAMTPNPPAMLYIKGNTSILKSMPGVAIVGSREVSTAGEEITKRITATVCEEKLVIVSGLAIGTDTNAHKAALKAKARTIAVLAHGLESAKPKQNARLANDILLHEGAWVSEYPMGRPAYKQSFVQRNRIQVGLSAASILVEASLNSGTMTQAEFALKAARPIFAVVPHKDNNPLHLNCEGNLQLVRNELARPLRTSKDYEELINTIRCSVEKIRENASMLRTNVNGSLF